MLSKIENDFLYLNSFNFFRSLIIHQTQSRGFGVLGFWGFRAFIRMDDPSCLMTFSSPMWVAVAVDLLIPFDVIFTGTGGPWKNLASLQIRPFPSLFAQKTLEPHDLLCVSNQLTNQPKVYNGA